MQPSSSRPEGRGGTQATHTPSNTTTETVLERNLVYRDDNIAYVVEGLYLGNITAAYSQPLLCRLDVQCVVDLSGTRPAQVPAAKKSICPCTCPRTTPHHRSRLCIDIPDTDEVDITQFSSEVTRFIHAAHLKGKNVLVHSYKGQSRAPALVILYLMTIIRMSFAQALSLVQTSYPCVDLNPAFRMTLQEVDRRLSPPPSPSPGPDITTITTTTTATTTHPKIRTAWT
ncbi:Dual specificity protein phosphatase 15 [Portunus trituberculatus]|uniref:protein-tyrosine-phosphatase n=1 Tax=Portunus trituberculatus TaxID=210409 RepID=A0A5B7FXX2_PORTR|nr:Dual specificity protein phosphatase 15 [Portunus trituberculatus]